MIYISRSTTALKLSSVLIIIIIIIKPQLKLSTKAGNDRLEAAAEAVMQYWVLLYRKGGNIRVLISNIHGWAYVYASLYLLRALVGEPLYP
jgi:hypothetical protein